MKKPKIFIACDTNKINEAKKILTQTKTNKLDIGYKFGLEFFYSKGGREFISKIKGKKIFLDLKFNDIPATCSKALISLKDLKNINYLTLHANAGEETIKEVVKTAKKISSKLKILLVTVLTSISNSSIKKIGHTKSVKEIVKKQITNWSTENLKNLIIQINKIELQIKRNSNNALNMILDFIIEKSSLPNN